MTVKHPPTSLAVSVGHCLSVTSPDECLPLPVSINRRVRRAKIDFEPLLPLFQIVTLRPHEPCIAYPRRNRPGDQRGEAIAFSANILLSITLVRTVGRRRPSGREAMWGFTDYLTQRDGLAVNIDGRGIPEVARFALLFGGLSRGRLAWWLHKSCTKLCR